MTWIIPFLVFFWLKYDHLWLVYGHDVTSWYRTDRIWRAVESRQKYQQRDNINHFKLNYIRILFIHKSCELICVIFLLITKKILHFVPYFNSFILVFNEVAIDSKFLLIEFSNFLPKYQTTIHINPKYNPTLIFALFIHLLIKDWDQFEKMIVQIDHLNITRKPEI